MTFSHNAMPCKITIVMMTAVVGCNIRRLAVIDSLSTFVPPLPPRPQIGGGGLDFRKATDMDVPALRTLAGTYFDAAYEMDAGKFAGIFHASSSVTKVSDDGNDMIVTPIAVWLDVVRKTKAPRDLPFKRDDHLLSIDVVGNLALLKVRLRIPPRSCTDFLSCLKVDGIWQIAQKVMTSNPL